jgi:mono/diheme cytochrome c family protein
MKSWISISVLAILFVGVGPLFAADAKSDPAAESLFVRRIAPLLKSRCVACHGEDPKGNKGELDLRTLEGLRKGGESKTPLIVAGDPEKSPFFLAVTRKSDDWSAMPPKEADKLSAEQIGWIREWIAGGAPWPSDARMAEIAKASADKWSAEDGIEVKTSGGLSGDWTHRKYKTDALWAYQAVKKPAVAAKGSAAIDALLAAKMPAGLAAAPPADRRTLIRRATFDLTGLPPTPEEVNAFVGDESPDAVAFAKVVERLLASPHYGERMAQHWLDVVRYADSSGFANDFERGNAWRYRDYVVRAFNADKPFDQFAREQIAGDEIDPKNPEMLVAVGFLRMGPWELTAMEVPKIARQRFLDDVTNSVGETFLAQSLQCCRCHDHKFDPVPTRDYYSIQAVFAQTQLVERPAAFLPAENVAGFEEKRFIEKKREAYIATLRDLDEAELANAQKWFAQNKRDPAQWNRAVAEAANAERKPGKGERQGTFTRARLALIKQGVAESEFPPKGVGFTPQQFGAERIARKGLERTGWEMDRYEPVALSVYDGATPKVTTVVSPIRMPKNPAAETEAEICHIQIGGDAFSNGPEVSPGVLSALHLDSGKFEQIGSRRKVFADWVASASNPLTTRAIVNRIWLWHFDQPIAGNPNNFGSTGKRPTHPELLDYLAATFVEQGWSIKQMHRLIMNSQAYQRSTEHPDPKQLAEKDPLGVSFAVFKPRRLTAEEMRDAMLAATGELNPAIGGIPNRPEINLEAALQPRQVMGTFASAWTPNPLPTERNRRSLYALKLRGLSDPMQEVFNAPAPNFSCERREASTVATQAFSLFNSQASHARALALAIRALKETKSDDAAIRRCFELAYGRSPTADETQLCLKHWRELEAVQAALKPVSHKPPLEVKREAVEENTGEKFSFIEKLHSNAEYVPDAQPADVDAKTRALADVCLTIFNANEFVYVY